MPFYFEEEACIIYLFIYVVFADISPQSPLRDSAGGKIADSMTSGPPAEKAVAGAERKTSDNSGNYTKNTHIYDILSENSPLTSFRIFQILKYPAFRLLNITECANIE